MEGAFGLNLVEQSIFSQCVIFPPSVLAWRWHPLARLGFPAATKQGKLTPQREPRELYLKEGISKSVLEKLEIASREGPRKACLLLVPRK